MGRKGQSIQGKTSLPIHYMPLGRVVAWATTNHNAATDRRRPETPLVSDGQWVYCDER
jgi:hypothetical protein